MRVYEIKKKENAPNVFGISLVATPAMESNYVALSKDNLSIEEKIQLSKENDIKFSQINKEKRLLLGLVLEPNKMIYRFNKQTQEEYYITVSEETILELQQDYIKQSNQNYSTLEHDGRELDGVTFTEHWIVEDSKIDKSALHNLSFKKGSWATVAKIENDTLWNDYIKTGEVMGFSIDAMVHLEEVNLNKETMSVTNEMLTQLKSDIIDGFRSVINLAKKEKPEEVILKEDDKKEAVKYEDMTDEEKKAFDAKKKAEKEKVAMSEDETNVFDFEVFKKAMTEMGVELSASVKEALKPLRDANVELKKEVETLNAEVVKLGEQPASKVIKSVPQNVDFSNMSNKEKMEYNLQNKR